MKPSRGLPVLCRDPERTLHLSRARPPPPIVTTDPVLALTWLQGRPVPPLPISIPHLCQGSAQVASWGWPLPGCSCTAGTLRALTSPLIFRGMASFPIRLPMLFVSTVPWPCNLIQKRLSSEGSHARAAGLAAWCVHLSPIGAFAQTQPLLRRANAEPAGLGYVPGPRGSQLTPLSFSLHHLQRSLVFFFPKAPKANPLAAEGSAPCDRGACRPAGRAPGGPVSPRERRAVCRRKVMFTVD